ncbi:hypothetical protein CEP54_010535 [Fusarium duplospermum]|uniref:Uncharacterized protein n=1 Tax=Fusarium duplospermum TaxID=1325734 RepID=A0A428PJF8_9HYPO|nr:hypothetical protein CEP54_010535 [Fusarium duplospermum]
MLGTALSSDSDDCSSGSETDLQQTPQTQEDPDITQQQLSLVKDIESGRFNRNLDIAINLEEFLARNSGIIAGGEHGTLIHVALRWSRYKSFDQFKPLFRLLVSKYPKLLETRNRQGETALHFAIQEKQSSAALFLCENAPPETVTRAIGCRGQAKGNCLHAAIRMRSNSHVTVQLISMCEKPSLLDRDDHGLTPLHLAVDFARCRIPGNEEVVNTLIARCQEAAYTLDIDDLSPFRFHLRTRQDFLARRYRRKTRQPSTSSSKIKEDREAALQRPERTESSEFETPPGDQETHAATSPAFRKANKGNDEKKKNVMDTFNTLLDEMETASYRLQNILKIFSPSLDSKQTIKKGHRGPDAEDARTVFEWLRLNGVMKVIRVAILDDFDTPHSEETIETALKGFDVEELDWMKKDICSETIRCAAPNVRILHLYWSGSNPVLRAWSEPDGLARLAKLEKVILTASQGIETRSRARENVETFLRRLENSITQVRPEAPVQITWQFDDDNMAKGSYTTSNLPISSLEPWISHLLKVGEFLSSLSQARHQQDLAATRKVRVCLIDDGVDVADLQTHEQLAGGASFIHSEATCRISPWYISEENHGTNMARLLQNCAPGMTKIYAAKVDVVNGRLSHATLNKALEWAAERKVDMICIGRPVGVRSGYSEESSRLRVETIRAMRRLVDEEIPVVCAGASRLDALEAGGSDLTHNLFDLLQWEARALLQVCSWARDDTLTRGPWDDNKSCFYVPTDGLPPSQDDASAKTNLDDASLAVAFGCALSALVIVVAQLSAESTSVNHRTLRDALSSMVVRGKGEGLVDVSRLSQFIEHQTRRQEKPEQDIGGLNKMAQYLFRNT